MKRRYTFRPKEEMMCRLLELDDSPTLKQYLYSKLVEFQGLRLEGPLILFALTTQIEWAKEAYQKENNRELSLGKLPHTPSVDLINALIEEESAAVDILHDPIKQLEEYRERLKKNGWW